MKWKPIGVGLGLIVVGYLILSCCAVVDVTELAVLTIFGRPTQSITEPGFYLKWPFPIQTLHLIDARLLVLDPETAEFLTKDKKNVLVNSFLCWRVKDPLRFIESLGSRLQAELHLTDVLNSELGAVLGAYDFSALVSTNPETVQLEQMMQAVTEHCATVAEKEFGIQVLDVRLKRLNFPDQNRASVFNRMRAERERIATRYRSEGEEQATKIKSEAERQRREILAKANQEAEELRGKGEAEAAKIYADSYGQDPEFYAFWETLQTYRQSLQDKTTVIIPADTQLMKVFYEGPESTTR